MWGPFVRAACSLLAAAVTTTTAPLGTAQSSTPQPVFKAVGATVSVHATVTDSSHRLVTNLGADAFTVSDDSGVRPITVFQREALPISVLMVLDSSYSMRESLAFLRNAARHFIAQMRPGDRVEIGAFNTQVRWVRPFTSDQRALNRILDFLTPKWTDFGTALWPAVCEGLTEIAPVEGRKVLLVFSDGENNIGDFKRCPIVEQAVADDVMIYAIALQTDYVDLSSRQRVKSVLDPLLPEVAIATGGGYFQLHRTDDLAATITRVAEELHHQYTLGFEAPVLDGKTHEITVVVNPAGLTARARRSYLAVAPK
jgi:Ca-activated chloride channel homolog